MDKTDKRQLLAQRRAKRRRLRKIKKIILIILACLLVIVLCVLGVQHFGKSRLQSKTEPNMEMESEQAVTAEEAEEGIVYYEDEKYRYNDQILTFLFMGIDNDDSFKDEEVMGTAGQSDCNFLAVLDTKNKKMELIGISRDTMTDIAIYDSNGEYMRTVKEHLAIQFAYGDGAARSCEMMVETVSNLMYGLPIHGYCALNWDGIAVLNDAIGGVEVTVLEDLTWIDKTLVEGETVTLKGKHAFNYVKVRNLKNFASNNLRIERQKQYLKAYANKAIAMTKEDIRVPLNILKELDDYMMTDISLDQITYLVTEILNYEMNFDNIRSIEGEVIHPEESRYEQFHVDYDALYELILDVFYEKIN